MSNTVKVVVEIPKETYLEIRSGFMARNAMESADAIRKGIPLPKGHGRLIDERQITKCEQIGLIIQDDTITRCFRTNAPTIIEAERKPLIQIRRRNEQPTC